MQAEERARLLLDQAPDAIIFADVEGRIVEWNAAAEAVFGYTAGEAVGQSLDLIVPERFREAHWAGFRRALGDGETKYAGKSLPTRSMRKDGRDIYVELTFAIVKGTDGNVLGALAHARDISERWAAEREQRQRLRELEGRLSAESQH
jgi:PAS domain S-box-containing protein